LNTANTDQGIILNTKLYREPISVSLARQEIREILGRDHPAMPLLELAASELVTNGLKHSDRGLGRHWLEVTLIASVDSFCLSVIDSGSLFASVEIPEQRREAQSGYGLALIERISRRRWGTRILPDNRRVVWCEIDANPTTEAIESLFAAPE